MSGCAWTCRSRHDLRSLLHCFQREHFVIPPCECQTSSRQASPHLCNQTSHVSRCPIVSRCHAEGPRITRPMHSRLLCVDSVSSAPSLGGIVLTHTSLDHSSGISPWSRVVHRVRRAPPAVCVSPSAHLTVCCT